MRMVCQLRLHHAPVARLRGDGAAVAPSLLHELAEALIRPVHRVMKRTRFHIAAAALAFFHIGR